jgi:hypothetical protein
MKGETTYVEMDMGDHQVDLEQLVLGSYLGLA